MNDNLLVFQNVSKVFRRVGFGFLGKATVQALKDISFSLSSQPEVLALVGESGSGKSTICRLILGLEEPTSGEILYKGKSVSDWLRSNKKEYIKEVQIIFQDPYEVYNPFYRVDRVLWMAIKKFNIASGDEAERLIYESLEAVGLRPREILGRYPHQLSGGERQRIMLSRIYLIKPRLLVADEPVSMLDASLRAIFLDHLREFKKLGISSLYITHDLNTAYYIADRIMIIYSGRILERGPTEDVIKNPLHPYTKMLITSIPVPDPNKRWQDRVVIDVAKLQKVSGREAIGGCPFYNRCQFAMDKCEKDFPPTEKINNQEVNCFLYG